MKPKANIELYEIDRHSSESKLPMVMDFDAALAVDHNMQTNAETSSTTADHVISGEFRFRLSIGGRLTMSRDLSRDSQQTGARRISCIMYRQTDVLLVLHTRGD